mmetsp:Transcript_35810/g.102981  ORF Transcript_35810/g.102981 Transcript_35810/m.102981 type:complete len:251 (-) Transcript_35810:372-1124(-)
MQDGQPVDVLKAHCMTAEAAHTVNLVTHQPLPLAVLVLRQVPECPYDGGRHGRRPGEQQLQDDLCPVLQAHRRVRRIQVGDGAPGPVRGVGGDALADSCPEGMAEGTESDVPQERKSVPKPHCVCERIVDLLDDSLPRPLIQTPQLLVGLPQHLHKHHIPVEGSKSHCKVRHLVCLQLVDEAVDQRVDLRLEQSPIIGAPEELRDQLVDHRPGVAAPCFARLALAAVGQASLSEGLQHPIGVHLGVAVVV